MDAHPGSGRITLDLRRLTSGKRNARPGVAGALTKIVKADKFQAKYCYKSKGSLYDNCIDSGFI
jgi:hypothetical protein